MPSRNHPEIAPPVTLSTLARAAKVHVSTVSRALSDDPSGISSTTVERIRALAQSAGYRRDENAAGLRTGRSRLIGVLVPRVSDLAMASVYESIDAAASREGYSSVVANTLDDSNLRKLRLDTLLSRRLDGVIVADSREGDAVAAELQSRNVPFVLVMRRVLGHVSVSTDDYLGGRLAAEHLLTLGHSQVGVIAGDLLASTGRERTAGFTEAFRRAGYPVSADRIVPSAFGSSTAGRHAGEKLLEQRAGRTLSAIFAVDDLNAMGAMGAIRAAGLRLGDDIALVGYNDMDFSQNLPIPLTSIRSPLEDMGRLSVELLLDRIEGKAVESVQLVPELVARATTTPLSGPIERQRNASPRTGEAS